MTPVGLSLCLHCVATKDSFDAGRPRLHRPKPTQDVKAVPTDSCPAAFTLRLSRPHRLSSPHQAALQKPPGCPIPARLEAIHSVSSQAGRTDARAPERQQLHARLDRNQPRWQFDFQEVQQQPRRQGHAPPGRQQGHQAAGTRAPAGQCRAQRATAQFIRAAIRRKSAQAKACQRGLMQHLDVVALHANLNRNMHALARIVPQRLRSHG